MEQSQIGIKVWERQSVKEKERPHLNNERINFAAVPHSLFGQEIASAFTRA